MSDTAVPILQGGAEETPESVPNFKPNHPGAQQTIDEGKDIASFLGFFTVSSSDVDFSFLSIIYLIMTALCMVLYVADKYGNVEGIRNYFIVLLPFVPCAIYALSMKSIGLIKMVIDPNLKVPDDYYSNGEKDDNKKKDKVKETEKKHN